MKRKRSMKQHVVSFRCPDDLLPLLDTHVQQLSKSAPGGNWTRSSAALNLVRRGLRADGDDKAADEAIAREMIHAHVKKKKDGE